MEEGMDYDDDGGMEKINLKKKLCVEAVNDGDCDVGKVSCGTNGKEVSYVRRNNMLFSPNLC
jgi:hypothetical protein